MNKKLMIIFSIIWFVISMFRFSEGKEQLAIVDLAISQMWCVGIYIVNEINKKS